MAQPSSAAPSPNPQIRAIVGLGNPGKAYAATRHNVGFVAIERLAARQGVSWSSKFNGLFARCALAGQSGSIDVALLQPQGFMNLSGHAVQPMAAFFGIKPAELLVIHDDLDLPFGKVQVKSGGGHGGHNGLRSVAAQLGSTDFARVRIGIGRPGSDGGSAKGGQDAVSDWVLSPFGADQRIALPDVIDRAVAAALATVATGVGNAMNSHNGPSKAAGGNKSANS